MINRINAPNSHDNISLTLPRSVKMVVAALSFPSRKPKSVKSTIVKRAWTVATIHWPISGDALSYNQLRNLALQSVGRARNRYDAEDGDGKDKKDRYG
ncbi:hypothetical protein MKZ38_002218 [Zalerion maritima]|uniref:Uncharacterized protein n=1 Tax=Zalerion maritima TaxID=339359 RepID=A0AAD5RQH6_9PEZI|nr:hypothetical protein MKZ38_002218 [Zalerion maritima]